MSCTYKFDGKLPGISSGLTFNIEAGSIAELLELVSDYYNRYGLNFKKDFISSDFLFYDTGMTSSAVINAAEKAFKDHKAILDNNNTVTHQAAILAFGPTGEITPDGFRKSNASRQLQEVLFKFRKDFGTIIHKFIQNKLEGKPNDSVKSELEDKIKELNDKLSREMILTASSLNTNEQELYITLKQLHDWIVNKEKVPSALENFNNYITSIEKAASQIADHYSDSTIHTEIKIAQKKRESSAKLLYGTSDLIVEKPDGTILIVDFKTSLTQSTGPGNMSDSTKLYHYAQLEAYRKILESHGYKASQIKGENLIITFNRKGISCDLNDPNYIIDPEAEQVTGRDKGNVRAMLAPYFPAETIENIDGNILNAILEKQEQLCSGMMLKRWQSDSLKAAILRAATNKNQKYMYSNKEGSRLCTLEIVSGENSENPIIRGYITTNDGPKQVFEKDIETLVKDEQHSIQEDTELSAKVIYEAIQYKDVNSLKHFIKETRAKERRQLWGNLYKYCSENYTMVECPELLKQGIIVVKHQTRGYELIVLSSESSNLEFSNDPSESILKGLFGDNYKEGRKYINKYKESSEMLRPSIGNMYAMRAFIALAELRDKIPTFKDGKFIGINVVSVTSGASTGLVSTDQLKKTSMVLQQICKEAPIIEKRENFTNFYDKVKDIDGYSTTEQWELMLSDSLLVCAEEYALQDRLKWDLSKTDNIDTKIAALDNLIAIMESDDGIRRELQAIGKEEENRGKVGAENESSAVRVYQLIKSVRSKLRDNLFLENSMNQVSINFQEAIVNGINLLTKGSVQKYTKNGLMLTGLAQGLAASNAYASPSKLIQRFQHFYDVATGKILKELQDELTELNKATENFINIRKKSSLIDKVVGNHNDIYKGLFALDANGQVSKDMLFQNPYAPDCKLTKDEKDYLEIVLWTLNRHRIGDDLKFKNLPYSEFKKSDAFEDYKQKLFNNSKYLQIPLKLREGQSGAISGLKQVLFSDRKLKDHIKNEVNRYKAMIERELLDEHQQSARDDAFKKQTYINYFEENEENRVSRTEAKNPEDWDWNVNSLCVEYALADLKQRYFKDLLSVADDQFAAIAIIEDMTGQDLSNQTRELFNRIKVSIYNKNLIDPEWQDLVSVLGLGKSALALTKIAVRHTLFLKEMLLGRIRNTSTILANQIHQDEGHEIKMSHLMEAAGEVFGPNFFKEETFKIFGKFSPGHKSMADKLNDTYAITDRDLSVVGDKFSYDSYGLHNFASRMLYVNTIAPDWFNRMILFIAKMKADGCYKAHTLNETTGELEYDITKDERINYYWAHRNTPNMNDEKFQRQKAYFIEKMRQFEQDGWRNKDGSKLVYGDQETNPSEFPRAYTTTEEESIKEQIGLVYGYYHHQERATYQKGLWYNLQTAFLTFLPAEVRKGLATGRETSIFVTRQEKNLEGKPLYWRKSKEGELTEKTTDNKDPETGEFLAPVMETVSDPYTGTIISTCKVIGLLCNKDYDELKRNPRLVKQMELMFFNMLFGIFIASIMALLASSGVKSVGTQVTADILKKTANELSFYHAVIEPVSDFNLVGVDFLNNTFSSAFKTITVDNYSLLDFANENFTLVKDLHLNALTNV